MSGGDRFEVRRNTLKSMTAVGLVAYIVDHSHPDLQENDRRDAIGLSISWHQSIEDANRVAYALNFLDQVKCRTEPARR